ncbi:MAG: methyltransferase [Prevotellaceae bacterium]|jgi:tRNA1Val (adenine37-N6)-methyltransferase|nr:methyltransferase [Prevotellaceae bacterium]
MEKIVILLIEIMNNVFQFKKFSIKQSQSAMKVGTDGVLLGSWCMANNAETALDIGCGTGLIALMLAQRFPNLQIDAVEIDLLSANEAKFNAENSSFNNKISVWNANINDFIKKNTKMFDLIISNPPFFENSLKSPDNQRTAARHTDSLSFEQLSETASKNLSDSGVFAVILPALQTGSFIDLCKNFSLNPIRRTDVYTTPKSKVRRCLLEFSKQCLPLIFNQLTIEYSSNNFTEEYKNLTKEFYLKF